MPILAESKWTDWMSVNTVSIPGNITTNQKKRKILKDYIGFN